MSLTPGTRLGPYEIVGQLGAGGMGEVYRAKDTKLNRDVAIKVLLGNVAHDGERRERFEREAQAIAALNHPNIVTIFGVESEGDTAFLAMELVEGRPLSELIPRGGLSLSQLLKIAIPAADAVAAAHQKGITHRDLKPANIMIGRGEHDGRVKVLDFGLAKLTGRSPGGDTTTVMPTALETGEGRILGTVAYMSPEQAEGKSIDARSDLFSLGVVLYEMATGDRPFTGDTSISIISSIVKDTPKSLMEINPSMPRDLARIVRRALAKDPEKRYQTAKDLRNDLEELKASLDSGELTAEFARSGAAMPARHGGPWRGIAIGAIAVAVIAVGTTAVMMRRGAASTSTMSAAPMTIAPLTNTGSAERATISSDGKYVAYVQKEDVGQSVWVRQLASGSTVRIVPPVPGQPIWGLTIGPDASFVDFVRSRAAGSTFPTDLWRVPFLGGQARKIVDDVTSAPGWSPDGNQMAYLVNVNNERRLVAANADGSQPRTIASRTIPLRYLTLTLVLRLDMRPMWLRDGRGIVVVGADEVKAPGKSQVIRVDVATGRETQLYEITSGSWAAAGMALSRDGATLFANVAGNESGARQVARIALESGETTPLTNDLASYTGVSLAGDAIVTTRLQGTFGVWLTDAAGRGARELGRDVPSVLNNLGWAGPGRLLYQGSLVGGTGVWSTGVADGSSSLLLPGALSASASADGRTLVFTKPDRTLWRGDGDGRSATLVPGVLSAPVTLTPDGSRVFYLSSGSGDQFGWVADLAGGPPQRFTPMHVDAGLPSVSADGRYVVFAFRGDKAAIFPVDGGPAIKEIPIPGGSIQWAPNGRELTYVDAAKTNIWAQPIDGGRPHQLTTFTDDKQIHSYAWSPDGKQLAMVRRVTTSDIVLLKGVK